MVVPIAADPDDPLLEQAIHALAFDFDDHIDLAVTALSHPRPDVRIAAVSTVSWSEPINAIPVLLACLDDADERVRTVAESVLGYFRGRRVLRRLAESRGPSWELMEAAFRATLRKEPALRDWMEPLRDVLGEDHAADNRPYIAAPRAGPVPVDVGAVMAELSDVGGPWAERRQRLRARFDWSGVAADDRARLAEAFRDHPDPVVRSCAADAFAVWDDTPRLLELAGDRNDGVAKWARWRLVEATPTRSAARLLRAFLEQPRRSSGWGEALDSYVHHAPRAEALLFVVDTMYATRSEERRLACLYEVLDDPDRVRDALVLFDQAPLVTWDVHIALLDTCRQLALPVPQLPALDTVDDLYLAQAIVTATAK